MHSDYLSGRARMVLARRQRHVAVQLREMHAADRVLSGALAACDANGQRESLGAFLESVQELRCAVQRLEDFLLRRVAGTEGQSRLDSLDLDGEIAGA